MFGVDKRRETASLLRVGQSRRLDRRVTYDLEELLVRPDIVLKRRDIFFSQPR